MPTVVWFGFELRLMLLLCGVCCGIVGFVCLGLHWLLLDVYLVDLVVCMLGWCLLGLFVYHYRFGDCAWVWLSLVFWFDVDYFYY